MNRQGFIGGSDCVKIMQGEWQELWEIKTDRREPDDLSDNIAVQLGTFTEDFNLQWYEKQYKCTQTLREMGSIGKSTEWSLDPFEVAARRIRAGEAVAETFLHGRQKEQLMQRTGINDGDIQKYLDPTAHTQ